MTKLSLDNRGYSLLEMSLVLFIVAIICSLSVGSFKSSYDAQQRKEFVQQLQLDLYYAQQKAISNRLAVNVMFLNGSKEYIIKQGEQIVLTRKYPNNTIFYASTLSLNDIAFLHNGNARKSGTLLFKVNNINYKIVVLLGRGRFYIEQL